jgi:hypothetical protein
MRCLNHRIHLLADFNVCLKICRLHAEFIAQLRHHLLALNRIPLRQQNRRPFPGEAPHYTQSDALTTARHDRDPAL